MDLVYNWHITELCNYSCVYCFAKWNHNKEIWRSKDKVSKILSGMKDSIHSPFIEKMITADKISRVRVNFAGGEPLMIGDSFIEILKKTKDIGLKSSLITNGSLLYTNVEVAKYVDMVGISVDSLLDSTNKRLGRCTRKGTIIDLTRLMNLVSSLRIMNDKIKIKFNIVVNQENYREQIVSKLQWLKPHKIKVLRVMPLGEEKTGISNEMYQTFVESNSAKNTDVFFEDNPDMTQSYLMIDPQGRFFQNGYGNHYQYSETIQEIGFDNALRSIKFNRLSYIKRYQKGEGNGLSKG